MSNQPWKDERWLPGVLNREQMISLMDAGIIQEADKKIDWNASALDLNLSDEAYEMQKGSIKPFNKSYSEIISDPHYALKFFPDEHGHFSLKVNKCYIFKIREKLHPTLIKSAPLYGQATAKSTIGRLDVIARLIVDGMKEYEKFDPTEVDSGEMYLEITPITFNVKVKAGISISQLRFFYGEIADSEISDIGFIKSILHIKGEEKNTGTLSVDISNCPINEEETLTAAAFKAKAEIEKPIELWNIKHYDPYEYWEPIHSTEKDDLKSIIIEKNHFYILRSKEKISLPDGVCIYCRAMDETLGEMRIHYAGFVHPCFGIERTDKSLGTPLIFEVRGHNVHILLTHNEILARLFFYRMSKIATRNEEELKVEQQKEEVVSYNNQALTLSKIFGHWKKLN